MEERNEGMITTDDRMSEVATWEILFRVTAAMRSIPEALPKAHAK